ncbi:hypothetical protein AGR1C_pTi0137 [Agrobacterium fabacearum TT111]|nr:hypothetical protein AGR1C_pTi0137 [Agrobacterium fabacearum TT111]
MSQPLIILLVPVRFIIAPEGEFS